MRIKLLACRRIPRARGQRLIRHVGLLSCLLASGRQRPRLVYNTVGSVACTSLSLTIQEPLTLMNERRVNVHLAWTATDLSTRLCAVMSKVSSVECTKIRFEGPNTCKVGDFRAVFA